MNRDVMEDTLQRPRKSFLARNGVVIVLVVLLIAAIGAGAYFYMKATADPQATAQKELDKTVGAVGKLMVLPEDETPTLATVEDPAKLQDQPFFKNAKKGDKVLIYTRSQKAILYDPSLNKIVEVAPVNLGETGAL